MPTGVRYPAHLLHLVVATLSSIQSLMPPQPQLKQPMNGVGQSGGAALQEEALKAAAMGAGGALRPEPVSPIDKRSLTKALRYIVWDKERKAKQPAVCWLVHYSSC